MNWFPTALLAVCVATNATAQSVPNSLHAAWLLETLDLDIKGAASAYLALARDAQAPAIDRQIAGARLEELHRLGVPAVGANTATEILPANLRVENDPASAEALRTAIAAVLAPPTAEAGTQSATERSRDPSLPPLRPLVHLVLQAARETDNLPRSPVGRLQQFGTSGATRVIELIRAYEIARAEVSGRLQEAADLRQRSFPTWKPQPWPANKEAAWKTVRENLVHWQQERQMSSTERDMLSRLLTVLEAEALQSPESALQRLDRLPLYAERLRIGIAKDR